MKNTLAKTITAFLASGLLLASCHSEKFDLSFHPGNLPEKTLALNLKGNVQVELPIMKVDEDFDTDIHTSLQFDSTAEGSLLSFRFNNLSKAMDSTTNSIRVNKGMEEANAFKAFAGGSFKTMMDATGKTGPVFGLDSFINAINNLVSREAGEDKAEALGLDTLLSNNSVTTLIDLAQHVLPGKAVAVGDHWENESELNPGFPFKVKRRFKLEKISGDTATISLTSNIEQGTTKTAISAAGLSWFLPQGSETSTKSFDTKNLWGMLLKHLEMDLQGKMTGNIYVDIHTGLLLHSELDQELQGSFKMGSSKVPMRLKLHYQYLMQ